MKIYSVLGLILMIFILPIIPMTIVWWYYSPTQLGGMILTGMIATGIYILVFFAEIFIILKVYE